MKAHVLATKINSVLRDNKFDRYVSGKTRGKLDFSQLSKIAYSPKVFKKKEARLNKDYKVIVIADASGSMGYSSKYIACGNSLELVANALESTDVEYALWSFNADILSLKDFGEKKPKSIKALYEKHLEDRMLYTCMNCYTAFGTFDDDVERCPECGNLFHSTYNSHYLNNGYGYNADGLALHLAMEHVQKLSGKHIVIVLSDGQADCIPINGAHYLSKEGPTYEQFPLRKVIEKIKKTDTILCSIGILSDDVNRFYPKENTVVLKDEKELGNALVNLIKKQITRG